MNTNYETAVKAAIRSRSLKDIQRGIHASMELQRDWNSRRIQARKSESQVMLKSILLAMRSNMEHHSLLAEQGVIERSMGVTTQQSRTHV